MPNKNTPARIIPATLEVKAPERKELPEVLTTPEDLQAFAVELLEQSPLMTGQKFTTEDLMSVDRVCIIDADLVDYEKGDGEPVHYAVVTVVIPTDKDEEPTVGYYCGGMILTKLIDGIINRGALPLLQEKGFWCRFTQKPTGTAGRKVTLITPV